jgi:hypothetical protein
MRILHVVPSFYPAYFYGEPIRSRYELCRNLALLGCDIRVLTTDAGGLDALDVDVEKHREVPSRKASGFVIATDVYAILIPALATITGPIHSLGRRCASHRSIQLPDVPDAVPLPGAQETCRLVAT